MVKPYDERRAKLEKLAREALAKVAKMDQGKKSKYTDGPSVKLWRILTGKKVLAHIREKWTEEQLKRMVQRARAEDGMAPLRRNKPPTGQAKTPARLAAQLATNLAACFHLVLATSGGRKPKERMLACEAVMAGNDLTEKPWAVLENEALKNAVARWEREGDDAKEV
jgi:hypothetical protein